MTTKQIAYLSLLIQKDIATSNEILVKRRNALTLAIQGINKRLTKLSDERTALVTKRDALNVIIQGKIDVGAALEAIIPVDE